MVVTCLPVCFGADESLGDEQLERGVHPCCLAPDGVADRSLGETGVLLDRETDALHEHGRPERLAGPGAVGRVQRDRDAGAVVFWGDGGDGDRRADLARNVPVAVFG